MRNYAKIGILIFIACACVFSRGKALAASEDILLRSIEEKGKELSAINQQIQETQKNIVATEEKGKTLKQAIKSADYRLSQLKLNIQASQIKIEKLGLEIQALDDEIQDKEQSITAHKAVITGFIRELQEINHENTLTMFLKNKSLAESLFASESISRLNGSLTEEINSLRSAKIDLAEKFDQTSKKKSQNEWENRTLLLRRSLAEGERSERETLLKTTKSQEKLYQEQLKTLEKQQADIAREVEEIERELRKSIDPNLLPLPRPGVLAWPVAGGRISQGYGNTAFAQYGYKGGRHNGVDIAAPLGTEVFAAESGEVVAADNQDRYCPKGAYGRYIVIKHENGLTTLYAHLSQSAVKVGEKLARGALIGYIGKTGYATGPHLHLTVWSSLTHLMRSSRTCGLMPVGGDIDPMQYLELPAV